MLDSAARPLLHLEGARVALPDGSELGPWTANATGQRLALVGNFHGWFRLLERQNRLVQGVAEVAGTPIELILSSGRAGFAPLDPPLPAMPVSPAAPPTPGSPASPVDPPIGASPPLAPAPISPLLLPSSEHPRASTSAHVPPA